MWKEAFGPHQLKFMAAASSALRGNLVPCPHCKAQLRAYFHVFQSTGSGTLWVWCGACFLHAHLPRTQAKAVFADPFARMSSKDFEALERRSEPAFLQRLEDLWRAGKIRVEAVGE